jgi:nucleoside-diphosphate-sugar epimerase
VRDLAELGVSHVIADVTDPGSYAHLLVPDVTYLDMTHPKHYHRSLGAVVQSGVRRAFFVTTTGVFSRYNQFSDIYKENEAKIRCSGINYTIMRPSMIYGSSRDKNMSRLIRFLSKYPAFPIFDAGRSLMQPVFVDDLADGIANAIGLPGTENREYNLAGPQGLPYRQIVDTILTALGRNVAVFNVPFVIASTVARYAERIPGFPITHEQVLRLQEDKVFDISQAVHDLDYAPRSFEAGIATEVQEMRAAGLI